MMDHKKRNKWSKKYGYVPFFKLRRYRMTTLLSSMKNCYWIKVAQQTLYQSEWEWQKCLSYQEPHYGCTDNQILTQHLTFLCGTMTLQHSTASHALLNKPVGDSNCVLRILFQLNCQISAERHLFKPLLLVFLHLWNLTRVYYGPSLDKVVKCMGNLGFAVVYLSHYFFAGLFVNHWDAALFSTSSSIQ